MWAHGAGASVRAFFLAAAMGRNAGKRQGRATVVRPLRGIKGTCRNPPAILTSLARAVGDAGRPRPVRFSGHQEVAGRFPARAGRP
jgi:hypothetical protein